MRKHNQIHTIHALYYKAQFQILRKLKDFNYTIRSENYCNARVALF